MLQKAKEFIKKAIAENKEGTKETTEEMERFEKELKVSFPKSLAEVYTILPIVEIETQYHCSKPKEEWRYYVMEWMGIDGIISEILDTASGAYFFAKGYLPIGMDVLGGGDYFYLDMKDERLPLYQCYHDDFSLEKIADSLADIFDYYIVE